MDLKCFIDRISLFFRLKEFYLLAKQHMKDTIQRLMLHWKLVLKQRRKFYQLSINYSNHTYKRLCFDQTNILCSCL